MVICPVCKGDKTIFYKSTDLTKNPPTKTGFDLTCHECNGVGEVTSKHAEAYKNSGVDNI